MNQRHNSPIHNHPLSFRMFMLPFCISCAQALIQQATTLMGLNDAAGRDEENLYSGISLCVIGRSGTGKTALTAKLASLARAANDQRPVIIRFCGTSKGSVNGLALVQSLCHQIQLVFQPLSPLPVPNNYDEAVLMFHSLLNQHSMVLFIDRLVIHTLSTHVFNTLIQHTSSQHTFSTQS